MAPTEMSPLPSSVAPPHPNSTIILYDGNCGVCSATADRLDALDNGRGRIDIRDLNTNPELIERHRLDPDAVRRALHVITPDGRVLTAMDAVRASMSGVGRGWMVGWTGLPVLRQITDRLYHWFARNRSWLSPSKHSCTDGSCSINRDQ